jgi:hypothetical protein
MMALKREEAKIIRDIKAAAKQGNQPAMKILAKSLVRLRGQVSKLQSSSAQLQGVGMTMTVRFHLQPFPTTLLPSAHCLDHRIEATAPVSAELPNN